MTTETEPTEQQDGPSALNDGLERNAELEKYNVGLATENEELRDLLRKTSCLMHKWDIGLDEYDGQDYTEATDEWERLLPIIDAELSKTDIEDVSSNAEIRGGAAVPLD